MEVKGLERDNNSLSIWKEYPFPVPLFYNTSELLLKI